CVICPEGTSTPAGSHPSCTQCTDPYYQPETGQSTCLLCAGSWGSSTFCRCPQGIYGDSCETACPTGTY
ncbi:hypothetical protein T484DRAFT_1592971, partial [Baffinella frigidus]